jgi:Pyruvate/2-oxoacid:ferredoxin oxidoreductase delta subunit
VRKESSVTEIESLPTPMGEMNVDRNGNVQFLDVERMRRKETPDLPLRRNRPRGLGIKDFVLSRVVHNRPSGPVESFYQWGFRLLVSTVQRYFTKPGLMNKIVRAVTFMGPADTRTGYTKGVWLPLNVDLSGEVEPERVPWDLLEDQIRSATFIGGMKTCVCRDSFGCTDYPHDLACMFFGKSGKVVVDNGLADQLTTDQALDRMRRAKSVGLNSESLHVELEQYVWGLKNDDMDEFQEVCFCCPCCCVGMKFCRAGTRDIKDRFTPSGWTATIDEDACIACGECAPACPQECIEFDEDGVARIEQEYCMGCDFCGKVCPVDDCIRIRQTMPMRDSIHDYFLAEDSFDMRVTR